MDVQGIRAAAELHEPRHFSFAVCTCKIPEQSQGNMHLEILAYIHYTTIYSHTRAVCAATVIVSLAHQQSQRITESESRAIKIGKQRRVAPNQKVLWIGHDKQNHSFEILALLYLPSTIDLFV